MTDDQMTKSHACEAGLGGLGRVRAVLRLGKRADARTARRAVLAARGRRGGGTGARARLRHRTRLAAARARRREPRRRRSIGADAGACRARGPNRRTPDSNLGTPRRTFRSCAPTSARCRSARALLDGARAVRHSAVAAPRARPAAPRSSRWRACSGAAARSASTWFPTCRTGANTRTKSSSQARSRGGGAV